MDLLYLSLHLFPKLSVQSSQRLVEEEYGWLKDKSSSDGNALLLASAKLGYPPSPQTRQSDEIFKKENYREKRIRWKSRWKTCLISTKQW
jgi:hypothetical protein